MEKNATFLRYATKQACKTDSFDVSEDSNHHLKLFRTFWSLYPTGKVKLESYTQDSGTLWKLWIILADKIGSSDALCAERG